MKANKVRIDLISIDAGTQQRPLDEDVLSRYMALMADGVDFPPIEIVSDGVNFWVWDGFHRIECIRRRGCKDIQAYVYEGTLRDAIWFSFGANKEHGLPRQKGVAKEIIKQILTDKKWSKQSLSAIAKHVGVTREYVSKTKAELSAHGVNSSHHRTDENANSEPKNEAHGASTCTIEEDEPELQRAKEIEVERGGSKYKQKSQEKQQESKEGPKDNVGRVIPEHLRRTWRNRCHIQYNLRALAKFYNEVTRCSDRREPVYSLLNITAFQAEYQALRRRLKSCIPYAVCVYCGGDAEDCEACQGFGFMNKDSYTAAPRELKA